MIIPALSVLPYSVLGVFPIDSYLTHASYYSCTECVTQCWEFFLLLIIYPMLVIIPALSVLLNTDIFLLLVELSSLYRLACEKPHIKGRVQ
jgi:hypothetical protein